MFRIGILTVEAEFYFVCIEFDEREDMLSVLADSMNLLPGNFSGIFHLQNCTLIRCFQLSMPVQDGQISSTNRPPKTPFLARRATLDQGEEW